MDAGTPTAVVVPASIVEVSIETIGRYFEPLCRVDRGTVGRDHERRFLERMARPFVFETEVVKSGAGRAIRIVQRLNRFNWIGRSLVMLQAHYPIVLIATRSA